MSAFSTAFTNLLGRSPGSGNVELPGPEDEPLIEGKGRAGAETCELRIEGMTCGACVEVSTSMSQPLPGY